MHTRSLIVLLIIIIFSACKKSSDAPATVLTTGLNVVNASSDTVNFYLNGSRINNNSNLYPAGASGYLQVRTGAQNFQVKKTFNQATSIIQNLFNLPLNLNNGLRYSLFISGETQDQAFTTVDTLPVDTLPAKALVRFVNASPSAGNLDMQLGEVKFTNQAFKSASNFVLADTNSLKSIMIYKAGTAVPIISGKIPVLSQNSYTFYVKETVFKTGSPVLSVGTALNN